MATTYFVKYSEHDDLENAYLVTCPKKKLPSFFEPTSYKVVAHDITDHVVYNPKLSSVVDEFVALGAAFNRSSDSWILHNDIHYVLEHTFDGDEIDDGVIRLLDLDDCEAEDFDDFLSSNLSLFEKTRILEMVEIFYESFLPWTVCMDIWRPLLQHEGFKTLLKKSLSKGVCVSNTAYNHSRDNADAIYNRILRYIERSFEREFTTELDFRFIVHRKHGHVDCAHREPYKTTRYTLDNEWF